MQCSVAGRPHSCVGECGGLESYSNLAGTSHQTFRSFGGLVPPVFTSRLERSGTRGWGTEPRAQRPPTTSPHRPLAPLARSWCKVASHQSPTAVWGSIGDSALWQLVRQSVPGQLNALLGRICVWQPGTVPLGLAAEHLTGPSWAVVGRETECGRQGWAEIQDGLRWAWLGCECEPLPFPTNLSTVGWGPPPAQQQKKNMDAATGRSPLQSIRCAPFA